VQHLQLAAYYGPSFMIDNLTYHSDSFDLKTSLINCHYPVDANAFLLQYGVIVQIPEGLDPESAMEIAAKRAGHATRGFEQDVEIWKNKARIDNPLLCEEDVRSTSSGAGTCSSTSTWRRSSRR
jgi:3-ketosteroid 9alpha-monooxygenase subunit A